MDNSCRLMGELMRIDDINNLPYKSIERIRSIICGTHNGVCQEKYFSDLKTVADESDKRVISINGRDCYNPRYIDKTLIEDDFLRKLIKGFRVCIPIEDIDNIVKIKQIILRKIEKEPLRCEDIILNKSRRKI